jgi:hypothetical protein
MLIPLEQWICDTCGDVIESVDDGWIEWLVDYSTSPPQSYSFRICHHLTASPRGGSDGCYAHIHEGNTADLHLHQFTLIEYLSALDVGRIHQPKFKGAGVRDLREWVELGRRLFLPYYEEARPHVDAARSQLLADGENEVSVFTEKVLKQIIDDYG